MSGYFRLHSSNSMQIIDCHSKSTSSLSHSDSFILLFLFPYITCPSSPIPVSIHHLLGSLPVTVPICCQVSCFSTCPSREAGKGRGGGGGGESHFCQQINIKFCMHADQGKTFQPGYQLVQSIVNAPRDLRKGSDGELELKRGIHGPQVRCILAWKASTCVDLGKT